MRARHSVAPATDFVVAKETRQTLWARSREEERRPELFSKDLRRTNLTVQPEERNTASLCTCARNDKGPHTFSYGSAVPERRTSSSCTCFCSGSELNDKRSSLPVRPVSDRLQHSDTPVSNRRKERHRTLSIATPTSCKQPGSPLGLLQGCHDLSVNGKLPR